MNKLLVVCGPTATGKTSLGVFLAKKFNGEIVSADSRQVYKGLDILTGKDIDKKSKIQILNNKLNIDENKFTVGYRLKDGIPIWLVDVVEPDYMFNVGEYKRLADKVISDIRNRHKLPIIVGGSGLYVKALTMPLKLIDIPPDKLLRKELSSLDVEELALRLRSIDKERWEKMNESDRLNPRRLIRAIEISRAIRDKRDTYMFRNLNTDDILMIGLTTPSKQKLYELIDRRIQQRLKEGVLGEVEECFSKRFDPRLPALSGTGYRALLQYLQHTVSLQLALKNWGFIEHAIARKQLNWFREDERIIWFDVTERNFKRKIEEVVERWYTLQK